MCKYYLSFDCATKTLGHVLVKIDDTYYENIPEFKLKIMEFLKKEKIDENDLLTINDINEKTKKIITIIDYNCVDLFPNCTNKNITTVSRITKLSEYINNKIIPVIQNLSNVTVLIEFQMNQNVQSKAISVALIALFYKYECHLVNPMLKNKICFNKAGHYSLFISKYKNNYTANKQHALQNFKDFELLFDQTIDISNTKKGHIADAFMQIFGFLTFANTNYY